jgi:hypothetical protein
MFSFHRVAQSGSKTKSARGAKACCLPVPRPWQEERTGMLLVLALDSIHSEQILVQISMLNTHAYARTGLTLIILETFRGQRLVWIALLIAPAHIRVQIDL